MNFDELMQAILDILPEATILEDDEGQLIISTNLMVNPHDLADPLIPFETN